MVLSCPVPMVSSESSNLLVMSRAADLLTPSGPTPPGASIPDSPAARLIAGLMAGLLLTAVSLPVRGLGRPAGVRDSFPFSHYPMFSAKRPSHAWVTHLLGVQEDGSVSPLHYSYLGTGGLNAVRRQVRRRVLDGDGQLLAESAAVLVASRDRAADRGVVRVHIVRGRYLVEPFMTSSDREVFTSRLDVRGSADVPGRVASAGPDDGDRRGQGARR